MSDFRVFYFFTIITVLYRELEEKENEMENSDYERKKEDDLQRRLSEAYSHAFHQELVR
jgi:MAternally-affected-uncoordination protein